MERFSTMTLGGCYKATVNESETIIEAQRLGRVPGRGLSGACLASNVVISGARFPVALQIERS
jgi:hypothetical protein